MGTLRKITLFKQGFGLFTHHCTLEGEGVITIRVRKDDLNAIRSSLTVLDLSGGRIGSISCEQEKDAGIVKITMPGSGSRTIQVVYILPVEPWDMSYRLLLSDAAGKSKGLLQALAVVKKTGLEPWDGIDMNLKSAHLEVPADFAQTAPTAAEKPHEFYEYHIARPVHVPDTGFALIPVFEESIDCENIMLFNPLEQNKFPTSGIILTNTINSPLAEGDAAIFQKDAFGGQAHITTIMPNQRTIIRCSRTDSCEVHAVSRSAAEAIKKVRIGNGMIILNSERKQIDIYEIQNKTTKKKEMVIEHPRHEGQKLHKPRNPFETTEQCWRFRISVPPDISIQFEIESIFDISHNYKLTDLTKEQITQLQTKGYINDDTAKYLLSRPSEGEQLHKFIQSLGNLTFEKIIAEPSESS